MKKAAFKCKGSLFCVIYAKFNSEFLHLHPHHHRIMVAIIQFR